MSLKDQAFRFIVRKRPDGSIAFASWLDPLLVQPGDVDATDMDDAEFERLVDPANRRGPCSMGVGCDESGVCYAEAHGDPGRCARSL